MADSVGRFLREMEAFLDPVAPPLRLLEIGRGTGVPTAHGAGALKARWGSGYLQVALDRNEADLRAGRVRARPVHPEVGWVIGDAYRLPWLPQGPAGGRGVTRLVVEMADTAYAFRAAHRVRLEVASSNFPKYDRHPNTAEALGHGTGTPARQVVHRGGSRASYLSLPVLRTPPV